MRKSAFFTVVLVISLIGSGAAAQEEVGLTTDPVPVAAYNQFVIGGQISMGLATVIADDDIGGWGDAKPRFTGGGFAYFDFYLMEMLALEGGLGIISKGARIDETIQGQDIKSRGGIYYLEIVLGAKLNIMNFRAALLFAFDIGLAGKWKQTEPNEDESDIEWDDDDVRRFNLGPKIALGYAIPVGPIYIVPGMDWSIHLLNNYTGDNDDEYAWRAMNLMFNVAVEFAL